MAGATLSPLNRDANSAIISDVVNRLVTEFNRTDTRVPLYAADTGTGTAYAIAPNPGITQYTVGQIFSFIASNANTSAAPTLNVNGKGAGTITRINGTALSTGDIPAGSVRVVCTATTPTFALVSPYNNVGATTFLGSNVATPTIGTFTAGPNTGSIGGNGQTFRISGGTTYQNSGGGNLTFSARLFDGTNSLVNGTQSLSAGFYGHISLSRVVTLTGAATFTLGATDNVGGNVGIMLTSALNGATNQATWIEAVRLA